MLEIMALSARYGAHPALQDVSLSVGSGEIVVMLGANGAGKSTLLRCIAGICEGVVSGQVRVDGRSISGLSSDRIVEQGIALVPEGRGIFSDLSVKENLLLGAHAKRARASESANLQRVLSLFPRLAERQSQLVRTMSGGEQQMVAIGRALMSNPDILLLDEPSLGLSPLLCKDLFRSLASVRETGIGILLVEQNARQSLAIADRGYLLENTRVVHEDAASVLINDPAVQKAYLGASTQVSSSTDATKPVADAHEKTQAVAEPFKRIEPRRRSAEQLTGLSIHDLVENAARASAGTMGHGERVAESIPSSEAASGTTRTASTQRSFSADKTGGHQSRLQATVREIEIAARQARHRPHSPSVTTSRARLTDTYRTSQAEAEESPVVIEVYRPPRVEVYRRRPGSSQLERE